MSFLRHFHVVITTSFKPWKRTRCIERIVLKSLALTSCSTLISNHGLLRSICRPVCPQKVLLIWQLSKTCWLILGTSVESRDLTEGRSHLTSWSSVLRIMVSRRQELANRKLTRETMRSLAASLFLRLEQTKLWFPTSIQTHKSSSLLTNWRHNMKTNILKSKTLWSYALGCASETWFPKLSTSSIEWKTSAESSPHATLKYTTSTFLVRNRWTKSSTRYSIQTRLSPTRRIGPRWAHTQFQWKPVPYSRNKSYPAL